MKTANTHTGLILRIEHLQGFEAYDAIAHCKSLMKEYRGRPTKPSLPVKHTASDVVAYGGLLKTYEMLLAKYENEVNEVKLHNNNINRVLEEHLRDASGLNSIPEQYRNKVWSKAWEIGHSSGYGEVYCSLCDLIEIFE